MLLIVNGENYEHSGDGSIRSLVGELGIAARVAVMVNDDVTDRSTWDRPSLDEGDRVEILTFAGGG